MTIKTQKYISATLIAIVAIGGFEALIYILNLNQPFIYLQVAFWIFAYLVFNVAFYYDISVKKPGAHERARLKYVNISRGFLRSIKIVWTVSVERFGHFRKWRHLRQWLHFLLVPAFIFWATFTLIYVNFGNIRIQQLLAMLSSVALIVDFWFLKEAIHRGKEKVDSDIFIALSMVKIYAATALYAGAMSILRYYCLPPLYFSSEVFCFSFLLVYLALYLHRKINGPNIAAALLIAAVMSAIGQLVYIFWGYDYFTAAIFMAVCYHLMWGVFHYHLDRALTWQALLEILIISLLIAGMLFSVTNFKARILNDCQYYLNG